MAQPGEIGGLGSRGAWQGTLAYGVAHYGKSLFWYAGELLFAFFLTEVGGIAPGWMGVVLAAGLLASALADIVVGLRMRRILTSVRVTVDLQLVGAVASAAALLALFATYWAPGGLRVAYALAVSLAFRLAYAFYDLPQNALISLATADERGRTRVVAMRFVFSGLAAMTVAGVVAPLVLTRGAEAQAWRFSALAAGFAVVAIASAWGLTRCLRDEPEPAGPPVQVDGMGVKLNGALGLLIGLMFVSSFAAPVFSKIEPYYAAFVLRDPMLSGAVLVGVAFGTAISQPLWAVLCARLSRAAAIASAALAVVLAASLFLVLGGRGGWAAPVCGVIFGAATAGLSMTLWAAYGDAVARTARGREALAFALFTAASKASLAVSALVVGGVLAQVDYRGVQGGALVAIMAAPSVAVGLACALAAWAWHLHGRSFINKSQ